MRLQKVYKFKYGKTTFEFKPMHKFSFIVDDSAKGKSWLCKQIFKAPNSNDFILLNTRLVAEIDLSKEHDVVFVIDEVDFVHIVKTYGYTHLMDSPNIFLIISRNIPVQLPVDYRAIYSFHSKDRKYWLERKYKDYTTFPQTQYYMIEDSGSGYGYFKSKHKNTVSINGKDNIINYSIGNNVSLIADGSAFARWLPVLLKIYPQLKLFLPESFEGLVLSATPSKLAHKLFHHAYTDVVLHFRSIEKYFNTAILKVYEKYKKSNTQQYLEVLDLENIQHYGITSSIAEHYNISVFDPVSCKEISELISNS